MNPSLASQPERGVQQGAGTQLLRRATAGIATAALAIAAFAAPAQAVDLIRIDSRDHPAELVVGATLGQSLTIDSDEVTIVGGMFATYSTTDSGFTLSLFEDGPGGALVASDEIVDARDNAWAELTVSEPLEHGEYYLEASEVSGNIAWWSNEPDLYPGGTAFADGEPVPGDRTLVARNDIAPPVDPPPPSEGMTDGVADGMTFRSDGMIIERDDGSGFAYDYAPTVIVEDSTEKMWWCGHNVDGDGIYYSQSPLGADEWSDPLLVMSADQEWENVHVCDPSVVAGEFHIEGTDYRYLMYYGAADLTSQNTKLGVAYSNDGVEWVKYADEPLLEDPQQIYDYGVGMPALFAAGDSVYAAYFNSGRNSSTVVQEVNRDGTLADRTFTLPMSSADTFADVAFSQDEGVWYIATKAQGPGLGDVETYVYRSLGPDLEETDWVHLGVVGEWLTGFPMNHNAGWYRDSAGNLYEENGAIRLVFGAQQGGQGTVDPDKWDLATVTITGSPDPQGQEPGAFALTTPADGETIDPLDLDRFSWETAPGATSYTLVVGPDEDLTAENAVINTTVHATSTSELRSAFATATKTQRMALDPGQTYYWSVRAVNPDGVQVASNGPFQLETTSEYDLDLTGEYVAWSTSGGGVFQPGDLAHLELPSEAATLRTGGDYTPLRADISDLENIELSIDEESTTIDSLVLRYKLQSDAYDAAWHTLTVPLEDVVTEGHAVIDMSTQPGWGQPDSRIAWFSLGSGEPGDLVMSELRLTAAADEDEAPETPAPENPPETSAPELPVEPDQPDESQVGAGTSEGEAGGQTRLEADGAESELGALPDTGAADLRSLFLVAALLIAMGTLVAVRRKKLA